MRRGIHLSIVRQLAALAIVCSLIAVTAAPASAVAAAIALSPDNGTAGTAVTVTATNFAPSSVLTAKFDGTPLVTAPATVTTLGDGSATFIIVIPGATAGMHTVTVSDSVNSAAASFAVLHGPKPAQDWAVIAGVSDYLYINDLTYCDDDAQDIYNRLVGSGWQPAHIRLLKDSQATKANIQSGINWMGTNAASQDLCLFFFSGHGGYYTDIAPIDETDGYDEYLCPYDALPTGWDNDIRDDELDTWLSPITARKAVIVDTCYGGGFFKGASKYYFKAASDTSYTALNIESADGFTKDINKTGFMVLAACDDNETSRESSALQNGVFTYYLDEGLGGPADINGNGVSAEEAFSYAAPRVRSYTGNMQNPQLWDGIPGEVILTPYTLTVNSTPGGSVIEPGTGTFTFDPGMEVDLLAVPDTGYEFVNWTGNVDTMADSYAADTTITLDSSYTITANFAEVIPPAVTTSAAGNITADSAILNGNLTAMGTATSVQVSFEWGNTTDYGNETPAQIMTGTGAFSGNITGLSPNTTYHFRVRAVGDGTSYGNDTTFTTTGLTPITGITRQVNGNISAGVSITLDGVETVVSDQNGQYQIPATATGNHTLVAHKDGFRDRTQTINIAGLGQEFAVTCNFQGNYGLIPNAPNMQYALSCINRWLYPPNPVTGLDMETALAVINAWLYPVTQGG